MTRNVGFSTYSANFHLPARQAAAFLSSMMGGYLKQFFIFAFLGYSLAEILFQPETTSKFQRLRASGELKNF